MSGRGVRLGLHLSAEEHGPDFLVRTAVRAEEAGFDFVTVSDHFHPWTTSQGPSPMRPASATDCGPKPDTTIGGGSSGRVKIRARSTV